MTHKQSVTRPLGRGPRLSVDQRGRRARSNQDARPDLWAILRGGARKWCYGHPYAEALPATHTVVFEDALVVPGLIPHVLDVVKGFIERVVGADNLAQDGVGIVVD